MSLIEIVKKLGHMSTTPRIDCGAYGSGTFVQQSHRYAPNRYPLGTRLGDCIENVINAFPEKVRFSCSEAQAKRALKQDLAYYKSARIKRAVGAGTSFLLAGGLASTLQNSTPALILLAYFGSFIPAYALRGAMREEVITEYILQHPEMWTAKKSWGIEA